MADAAKLVEVGWREWAALPDLGIARIKAKMDTGARTSALHCFSMEKFLREGRPWLRFGLHPLQQRKDVEVFCESAMVDERVVSDSGGHHELRPVILTSVQLGGLCLAAEFTLTNRDSMRFRMLLGRTAMKGRMTVNPAASYLLGKPPNVRLKK